MKGSLSELKNRSGRDNMIKSVFLLFVLVSAVVAGGCLDSMQVPVIKVVLDVGLNETTGNPVIEKVDMTPMTINALKAPKASSTRDIANSVSGFAIHNFRNIGYWDAVEYKGPGNYELTLAFPSGVEIKKNDTIAVEVRITDDRGKRVAVARRYLTWE